MWSGCSSTSTKIRQLPHIGAVPSRTTDVAAFIASAVAILKYDAIISYFVRFAGPGASPLDISVLAFIAVLAVAAMAIAKPEYFVGAGLIGAAGAAHLARSATTSHSNADIGDIVPAPGQQDN